MTKRKNVNSFISAPGYKDEDYIHYVYKIVNIINNKYYIGIHSTLKSLNKEPLEDGYWGSGIEIEKAIKKEGKNNFRKEILGIFNTRREISDEEQRLVTIEVVRSSESYNMIVGGDNGYQSNIGWVVCRPKEALDKVIKITREEYYKNKDLYIITEHLKSFIKNKSKGRANNRLTFEERKSKRNSIIFNNGRNKYININTLEERVYIGKDIPNDLFTIWYPHYFINKSTSKLITKEYIIEESKKVSSLDKLAKLLNINKKSLYKIMDHYKIRQDIKNSFSTSKIHSATNGFKEKTYVYNDTKELVIDLKDLDSYLNNGYFKGRKPHNNINYQDLYNFYVNGNGIKACVKKFKISENLVKQILKLDENSKIYWIYSSKENRSLRILVNGQNMLNDILSNGWIIGRHQK